MSQKINNFTRHAILYTFAPSWYLYPLQYSAFQVRKYAISPPSSDGNKPLFLTSFSCICRVYVMIEYMMTSLHRNAFRITDILGVESTNNG